MTRVISISDDVYEELSRQKGGKSFSELFRVLLKAKPSILDLFGAIRK